ncbi:putative reverse transcriptase domain-containing protein [Tanacetum coccineum]
MTARKRVRPLPAHRLAWRRVSPYSSDHHSSSASSSSDHSPVHSSSFDTPGQPHSRPLTRVAIPRLVYPLVSTPRYSEAFCHWRAAPLSTVYPPTTFESLSRDSSSEKSLHSSSHSARPSRKRCRSPAGSVPLLTPASRSLAPTYADLLPPRKRFRDLYLSEASIEEDIEVGTIETEVGLELVIGDEIVVRDRVEIDPKDDRDDAEEYEADTSTGGMIEVGIDPMSTPVADEESEEPTGGDSSDSSSTRDGSVRSVKDMQIDLGDAVHDFYHHMSKIFIDRVIGIETAQRQIEDGQMLASTQRLRMIERIESLRLENLKEEFHEVRREHDEVKRRLKRTMTNTHSGMTPAAIEEMINQCMIAALNAHEANKNHRLENGNEGGDGNGDGNGGGDRNCNGNGNNGGNNGNGNENHNVNGRGDRPVARECEVCYLHFTRQCINLVEHSKRTIKTNAAYALSWRELLKLMTEVYCPRNEIQKMETELWNLKNWVEKFIGGLPDNIQRNIIAVKPTRLQDAVRISNHLMDKKLKGYTVRNTENKRRLDNNHRDNRGQQPPYKQQNTRCQNVVRAYTAGNNEKKGYGGTLPFYNRCRLHHEGHCTMKCNNYKQVGHMTRDCKAAIATTTQETLGPNQRVITCFECGVQGHYRKDCPKVKNQNCGNKERFPDARGKAYVLGGGDANPDANTVTGTFLLNGHHAYLLFDLGANRSFVSNTFSALLDIIPSTLDVSYAVELVDGRTLETNTVLRGCTLGLLGHPFNIGLMPIDLGSFDVIIGIDWLANNHAVIVRIALDGDDDVLDVTSLVSIGLRLVFLAKRMRLLDELAIRVKQGLREEGSESVGPIRRIQGIVMAY